MTDRKRVVLFALLALVAAFALVAAGCGGGGSDEAGGDETTIETTVDETTSESTDTMTDETTEETTTDETTEDTGDLSAFASEDCLQLAGIGAKLSEALSASGGDTPDFDASATYFQELVDKAPDEIKDDLAVIADAWKEIASTLSGVDLSGGSTPDPETLAKLQELGTKLSTPELQQASQNIANWAKDNCTTNG